MIKHFLAQFLNNSFHNILSSTTNWALAVSCSLRGDIFPFIAGKGLLWKEWSTTDLAQSIRDLPPATRSHRSSSSGQDRENQWNTNFNLGHSFKIPSLKIPGWLGIAQKCKCSFQVFTFVAALNTTSISTCGKQAQLRHSVHNHPLCCAHMG